MKDTAKTLQDALFLPAVRPAGPLVLGKGETKKVKHAVDWKLYDKDDLVVRLTAPDALTVPAELKLSADRNDFEYDVTAGQAAGEFTVTLTPAVGRPVAVRVTVR